MFEHSALLDQWLARLDGETDVDLLEHGPELVPELLEVYTPDDFTLSLLEGSWLRARDGHIAVELTGQLIPDEGVAGGTGVIQRRIDTLAGRAEHFKLELPEAAQGYGRGRRMVRRSVDLYSDLGIQRVGLLAVDKGRYVWAASGFGFVDEQTRQDVVEAVEATAELLGLRFNNIDPDTCEPWDLALLPGVLDMTLREALEVLAPEVLEDPAVDHDALSEPFERPGKLLLLAEGTPGWQGFLDLRPSEGNLGLEIFYDYTG